MLKVYSTVFLMSLLASCSKGPSQQQSSLAEAQSYNNNREYSKTISILESESSLSNKQKKELVYAYAGAAGFEAGKVKQDIESVNKILEDDQLKPSDKVKEILKIIPRDNQKKLSNLNMAIKLFNELQKSGDYLDPDSRFQLGVLYFYRSLYNISVMMEFIDEGIGQKLESKVSGEEFNLILDFFNKNMGSAFSDIGHSYEQLINSYDKIKKMAKKIDETFNFFLSDKNFKKALKKDFNQISELYSEYLNKVGKRYGEYFDELNEIADALGLEKSFQDIFVEFQNNPEKAKKVQARIEIALESFFDHSQDKYEEEFKHFNKILSEDIKEELKVKIAESWRAKSTKPIANWLRSDEGNINDLREFIKTLITEVEETGLDKNINSELGILVKMIDEKAADKFGRDLEAFNSSITPSGDRLVKDIDKLSNVYEVEANKKNEALQETLDKKLKAFDESDISKEKIEFTEEEKEQMRKNVKTVEKIIED